MGLYSYNPDGLLKGACTAWVLLILLVHAVFNCPGIGIDQSIGIDHCYKNKETASYSYSEMTQI